MCVFFCRLESESAPGNPTEHAAVQGNQHEAKIVFFRFLVNNAFENIWAIFVSVKSAVLDSRQRQKWSRRDV